MSNRITLEALKAKNLAGEGILIKLILAQRLTKVVGKIELTGVELVPVTVATSKGAIKYWTGFVDGLIEVCRCIPVTTGAYSVTIEGGALLAEVPAPTAAEVRAGVVAALVANTAAAEAAAAQVDLLADVPNMVECLEAERVALQARLDALPPA
jgi:hypothetical protein